MPTNTIQEAVELLRAHPDGFHSKIALPDERTIRDVEAESGLQLPPDYRYLVESASNIVLRKELHYLRDDREGRNNFLGVISSARRSACRKSGCQYARITVTSIACCLTAQVQLWSHDDMFEGHWPDLAAWTIDVVINGN